MNYKELQAVAKENGVKANLSQEKLIKVLAVLLDQEAPVVTETAIETKVDEALANAFEGLVETESTEVEITSHNDLEFEGYVSDGIAKYVFTLYKAHELDVRELNGKTYAYVKSEVDRLSALPFPASPKQKEIINSLIAEMKELKPEFDVPQEVLKSLTGGKDGSAGEFIQFLYQQRNVFSMQAPLSDKQAESLATWMFCPDIPWNDFEITLKKPYPTELNANGWMFLTAEEFMAQLKERMTKEQASEFIGAHKDKYYEWKKTRINDYQKDTIRKLEDRLANISKLGVKTYATDENGVVQEVYVKPKRDWNPTAYAPLEEFHLAQMDKDSASKYIKQLESEVAIRQKSALEPSSHQEDLEAKRQKYKASADKISGLTQEYQALIDLVFALEAVAGQENDSLHESITELMIHKRGNQLEVASELYEFIDMLLSKRFIKFENLAEMCAPSTIATKILEIKYPQQLDDAMNGKASEEQKKAKREVQQQEATAKADDKVKDFMAQFNK